ncbi:MAG: T9SS type A sorting domain-containing protein [Saprospiraceae bacterium]
MNLLLRPFIIISCLVAFNYCTAQTWTQIQKIVHTDRSNQDFFAADVAIDGDYAIVGAPEEDQPVSGIGGGTSGAGSAYIFKKDANGDWNQLQKIVASERSNSDKFGSQVTIFGDYAAVTSRQRNVMFNGSDVFNAGAVFLFKKDGNDNWTEIKRLVSEHPTSSGAFGRSIYLNNDYIIVGANQEGSDANGNNEISNAGAAYIFQKNEGGVDNWGLVKKLVANSRATFDWFGSSVAIEGDYAVVGAYFENEDANENGNLEDAGSVYLFKKNTGGANNWGFFKKIVASDRSAFDNFGRTVDLDNATLIVSSGSASGSVYIFPQNQGSTDNWGESQKLTALSPSINRLGSSLALAGDFFVVGSIENDYDESDSSFKTNAGAAFIFNKENDGSWQQIQKIVPADRESNDEFGNAIAINGDNIVVGAFREDENANGGSSRNEAGSAYIFNVPCSDPPKISTSTEFLCETTGGYNITVQITSAGSSSNLEILANDQVEISNAQVNQNYTLGSFSNSTIITVQATGNADCGVTETFNISCNPSGITKLYNASNPRPTFINGFGPRLLNLYTGESIPGTYNYFGNNFYSQDNHLWEFDGCQLTEIYQEGYSLISENVLDGNGSLIIYGITTDFSETSIFKWNGQTLTQITNPPAYRYSSGFHLANSSTNNNYFTFFNGVGQNQLHQTYFINTSNQLIEITNPAGYQAVSTSVNDQEKGFADNNGNVFILFEKINNEFDKIWGIHDGTNLTLINYSNGDPFDLDFKGLASNGDVIFAGISTPSSSNVYKYNQNGLAEVPRGAMSGSAGIDSKLLGSDGTSDYFSQGNSIIKYNGTELSEIFPPSGTGSTFVKIDDSGMLWGSTVVNGFSTLYTYDGTNYTLLSNPSGHHFLNESFEINGTHFFIYKSNSSTDITNLVTTVAYYQNGSLQLINRPSGGQVVNRIWKAESTGEVYISYGNWGLFPDPNPTGGGNFYQSNTNEIYRFTTAGLEQLPKSTSFPWLAEVYDLAGKPYLILQPAYDDAEMVIHSIEDNVVAPLMEHFVVDRILTPYEADYMLVRANDYDDLIKILPDDCDDTACPSSINISGDPMRIGYYQAAGNLRISKISRALGKVVAGNSITLEAGFQTVAGSEFIATVIPEITAYSPCMPNISAPDKPQQISSNPILQQQIPLAIYPNPTSHTATIDFTLEKNTTATIELIDVNGRVQQTILTPAVYAAGQFRFQLNTTDLDNAIYFIRLTTNDEQQVARLLLLR